MIDAVLGVDMPISEISRILCASLGMFRHGIFCYEVPYSICCTVLTNGTIRGPVKAGWSLLCSELSYRYLRSCAYCVPRLECFVNTDLLLWSAILESSYRRMAECGVICIRDNRCYARSCHAGIRNRMHPLCGGIIRLTSGSEIITRVAQEHEVKRFSLT